MATINGTYIFVSDEQVKYNVTTMTHPVEEGIDLTDHVSADAQVVSISGKIVGDNAAENIAKLAQWQRKGALVDYVGRNYANRYQIISFNTSHPNTVAGGCDFDMELREIRIATSPYKVGSNVASKNVTPLKNTTKTGTQQKQTNSTDSGIYHTVKKGETAWSIAKKYNTKGSNLKFILDNNASAPKTKGDWTTLQAGTKILVAKR